ncbi:hypothetical protein G3N57_30255, partial [Paraburkholderia sp. Se-20369]|nr:hypothetical protein [Paraburkholderia sp. Se-20369]
MWITKSVAGYDSRNRQNLLASPLDARHYVMEDWAYTPPPAEETRDAPPPGRRRRRW